MNNENDNKKENDEPKLLNSIIEDSNENKEDQKDSMNITLFDNLQFVNSICPGTSYVDFVKDKLNNNYIIKRLKKDKIMYDKLNNTSIDNSRNFDNEIKSLTKLNNYNHFPKLLAYEKLPDYKMLMTHCGDMLNKNNLPENWKEQLLEIHNILEKELIYHNDTGGASNICILNNNMTLIDFGESGPNSNYPYFNLSLNILKSSKTIEEVFQKIREIGLGMIACLYIRNKNNIDK